MSVEITPTRDLRGEKQDYKRDKDSRAKWSHGQYPVAAGKFAFFQESLLASADSDDIKTRPYGKRSDRSSDAHNKDHGNVNKPHPRWNMPAARIRTTMVAREPISDPALRDLVNDLSHGADSSPAYEPAEVVRGPEYTYGPEVVYSDKAGQSPQESHSLETFVKTDPRATEKLLRKEYEILDDNGEPLRGHKARQHLRQGAGSKVVEDDGFELV